MPLLIVGLIIGGSRVAEVLKVMLVRDPAGDSF
jgi:hypothetical protein